MPSVDVRVLGRTHTIQCDDGEENRVRQLAQFVDQQAAKLSKGTANANDAKTLLATSILIADELADTTDALARMKSELSEAEDRAAVALERAAEQLESIAAKLEGN